MQLHRLYEVYRVSGWSYLEKYEALNNPSCTPYNNEGLFRYRLTDIVGFYIGRNAILPEATCVLKLRDELGLNRLKFFRYTTIGAIEHLPDEQVLGLSRQPQEKNKFADAFNSFKEPIGKQQHEDPKEQNPAAQTILAFSGIGSNSTPAKKLPSDAKSDVIPNSSANLGKKKLLSRNTK